MSGVAATAVLLLVAVTLVVLPPLLASDRRVAPSGAVRRRLAEVEARRDEIYLALREADLDWRTGKLTDGDLQTLRERLLAEAAAALREIDTLAGSLASPAAVADPGDRPAAGDAGTP